MILNFRDLFFGGKSPIKEGDIVSYILSDQNGTASKIEGDFKTNILDYMIE